MKTNLLLLHNTLSRIETKGEATKLMAQCLFRIEQMIKDCDKQQSEPAEKAGSIEENNTL